MPDDAEVKLYLRLNLAEAFDLPIRQENRLYNPGDDLTAQDLTEIRQAMDELRSSNEVQRALQTNEVWITYLTRTRPKRFAIIENAARNMLEVLRQQEPDKSSKVYLKRHQSIIDVKAAQIDTLISNMTQDIFTTGEVRELYQED